VVVLAVAATVVHLLLTWMERRGWIWYRTKDGPRPKSLGLLEEIYQPSVEHVIDQAITEETEADQAALGEPEKGEEEDDPLAAP
jgi:hypothetical protein